MEMKRREFIALIGLSAAWTGVAQAQQRPTLGLLSSSEMADWAIKSFRAGLSAATASVSDIDDLTILKAWVSALR
jgi:hypothetical protein